MDKRERAKLYLSESPTKRKILRLVETQPRSLTDIAKVLKLKPPTVHQHVTDLVEMGLATKEAIGRRAIVSPTDLARDLIK